MSYPKTQKEWEDWDKQCVVEEVMEQYICFEYKCNNKVNRQHSRCHDCEIRLFNGMFEN